MRVGHHVIDLHNWPAAIETQHLVKRVRHPWYHIQHYVLIGFKVDRKLELHCGSPEYQALFHDCPLLYIIYLGLECCRFPHISHTCTCGQIFRCAWDWLPICLAKVTFVPKSLTKWIQSFAETTSRRDLLPFLNIYLINWYCWRLALPFMFLSHPYLLPPCLLYQWQHNAYYQCHLSNDQNSLNTKGHFNRC